MEVKFQNAIPLQPNSCYRLLIAVPIKCSFWNFEFAKKLLIFFFLHCTQWGIQKAQFHSKTTHLREKRVKIWSPGMYLTYIWVFLTLNMSRSFWNHSVHFLQNLIVTQTVLIVEQKEGKFGPRGYM